MNAPIPNSDPGRLLLRHLLATLAYRAGKVLSGAPEHFANLSVGDTTRTPAQILAHMGDLLDWAFCLAQGTHRWHDSVPLAWPEEVERFFSAIAKLDIQLAADVPLGFPADKLIQGPLADALTHVGQLALLRRLAGTPVRAENYFKAEIVVGRVGPDQSKKRVEFD